MAAFRGIENQLRTELGVGGDTPFSALIRNSSNRVVVRYLSDLLDFADLRNAITHRRSNVLLATPTEEATVQLESLLETFANPPRIDSVFGTREVSICGPTTTVRDAARIMRVGDFSQVPVYADRSFTALLTAETLTRWLSADLDRLDGILEDVSVADALVWTEDPENCAFLARSTTVLETLDLFGQFSSRGKTLDAILVTHDGRATLPLNIITIYDVPKLLGQMPGAGSRLLA